MNRQYVDMTVRFLLVVTLSCLCFFGFIFLFKYTYPFIIGLIIAYLINPIVNFLEFKAGFPRLVAVLTTLIGIFAVLAALITWLVIEIVAGTEYLSKALPEYSNTILSFTEAFIFDKIILLYDKATSMISSLNPSQQETIMNNIELFGKKLEATGLNFLQALLSKIPVLITWFPNTATLLGFSLLGTFFISKDWFKLGGLARKILPSKAKRSGKTVFTDLKRALFGFIKAQASLISISTVITLIGLLILRVNYAVTIALLIGIVDILPYLGTGLVFLPWLGYEVVAGDLNLAIGIAVIYTLVVVQRQLMEPKILSSNIGVDPLASLISLFVGFKLIGFLGLILGPVILVLVTSLYRAKVFHELWAFIKADNK